MCDKNYDTWNKQLPSVCWGLRSMTSPLTGVSPHELMHGTKMALLIDRLLSKSDDEEILTGGDSSFGDQIKERVKTLLRTHKVILAKEEKKMKERYDQKARPHEYKEGDLVYLKDPVGRVGVSRKLLPEYYPDVYEVIQVDGTHNVWLKNSKTGKKLVNEVHVDRLKLFVPRV